MAKITQYINMMVGNGWGNVDTANVYQEYPGIACRLNTNDFDGNVSFYFEACLASSAVGGTMHLRLYNHTDSTVVASSDVSTASTAFLAVRLRSGVISLAGDKTYTIQAMNTATNGIGIYGARIVVVQSGNITKTQIQIELGNENSTASTSATNLPVSNTQFLYEAGKYDGTVSVRYDSVFCVDNAANTATTALYDVTGAAAVSGATLNTNVVRTLSFPYVFDYQSTGALTLTDQHVYQVALHTTAGTAYMETNKLVLTITGSPTKFLSMALIGTLTAGTANTTQITMQNAGDDSCSLDMSDFSGCNVAYYYEGNMAINNGAQTVTSALGDYNSYPTNSTIFGTTVTLTGQTTPSRVRSAAFTPNTPLDVSGFWQTSNAAATASLYNTFIVMQVSGLVNPIMGISIPNTSISVIRNVVGY